MSEFLQIGILPVVLTLAAFQVGLLCQKKFKSAICNPTLIGVVLVVLFLFATGMEVETYQSGTSYLSWLLTPATVCLAVPMYEQFQALKKNLPAIAAGVAAGAVSCMVMVVAVGALCGFERELTVSLLPKSVTTAIGLALSEMNGGMAGITTAAISVTGIFANVVGVSLCKLFRITDPVAKGAAFGTAGHVVGTAKANELGQLTGAVSSLSLVVAGLLTAVLFPVLLSIL